MKDFLNQARLRENEASWGEENWPKLVTMLERCRSADSLVGETVTILIKAKKPGLLILRATASSDSLLKRIFLSPSGFRSASLALMMKEWPCFCQPAPAGETASWITAASPGASLVRAEVIVLRESVSSPKST